MTDDPKEPDEGGESLADSDLYRLFFDGVDARGSYRPDGIELQLGSADTLMHDIVWLHEIHHRALNDDTAWGAALRVAFGDPGLRKTVFLELLRACRRVHEAFATYLSVHLAGAKFPSAETVLQRYPAYMGAYRAMDEFLAEVNGAHQRDLAATAVARACMQTPVLAWFAAHDEPRLAQIPVCDRPDARFRLLRDRGAGWIGSLAAAADAACAAEFGSTPGVFDERLAGATDAELDGMWTTWEDVVYAGLRDHLVACGSDVLSRWEHVERELVLLSGRTGAGSTRPRGEVPSTDAEEAETMLRDVSFTLPAESLPARLLHCDHDVDPEEVVRVVDATSRVEDRPELVLHLRRADRLLLSPSELVTYEPQSTVVGVRALTSGPDDGSPDELTHVALANVAVWRSVLEAWGDRGPVTACIAASCLADSSWQQDWFSALGDTPIVILLDIGVEQSRSGGQRALLPASAQIDAAYVGLGRDALQALVCEVAGRSILTLVLAPRAVTQVVAGQLTDTLDGTFSIDGIDWERWEHPLQCVLRSLLATEARLVMAPVRADD